MAEIEKGRQAPARTRVAVWKGTAALGALSMLAASIWYVACPAPLSG